MRPLLSAEDKARIEAAVREVEAKSAVELVTIVAPYSDGYVAWRWLGATLSTAALSLLARTISLYVSRLPHGAAVAHWLNDETLLFAQLPLVLTLFWATGMPWVLRALTPRPAVERAVHRAARLAFFEHNVYRTRDGSGVLLYLSRFERRVELLADRTIHARVGADGWPRHVATIVQAIREGRSADGICSVLGELGSTFAAEVPRRADDVNELPDAVIELG